MGNPFDQFDAPKAASNPFDRFDDHTPVTLDMIPGNHTPRSNIDESGTPAGNRDNILGKLFGLIETPIALATGTAGALVGSIAGVGKTLVGGKYGTQEGVRQGDKLAGEVTDALTYQPRTDTGREIAAGAGKLMADSGIIGVPIPELNALGRGVASSGKTVRNITQSNAAAMAAQDAGMAVGATKLRDLVTSRRNQMAGVGAANTEEALLRSQRAADLPVPIQLTTGQKTRTFEQQRFERETAKLPKEGAPLRERFAEQNNQMMQNFDAFVDGTGAQAPNLRGVGKIVTDAVVSKMKRAKKEINAAYDAARDAGQMGEMIDINPLLKYVDENRPASINAPVLNSVEMTIAKLDPEGTGLISLNDLEELRKMTGRLSQPGTPNMVYGQDVKSIIDSSTAGKGGVLYQQARRMYENYSNEFRNKAVIDKLIRNKPGTTDRAVAYEDVLQHSILSGSLDDVRAVRRTLQTAGADGEQAWRELQGATINHVKESITANSARDVNGNAIVSPHALNKIVANLDADGKLDFVFGKKGAQQIRDINDLAKDVYTAPPGSVNHSNTASVLIGLLDTAVSGVSGMPLPIGSAINFGVKRVKSGIVRRQVEAALAPSIEVPGVAAQTPSKFRALVEAQRARKLQGIGAAQSVDDAIIAAGANSSGHD